MNSEIDNVTNYVSTVPLKELGLGLGEEHLSDEQVQELTDDYSLPALKVLFQLWVGQSSEFFRRLALLLSPNQEDRREHGGDDESACGERRETRLMHQVVAEVTGPLRCGLSGCLSDLQRSYEFHRYFETQHQSQGSDRARSARQKCRELNSLHTSVRSLQLHLKALLNEMIILEDELEKLMVSRETVEVTCTGYQELQDRLRLLQPHMQASSSCWDETVAQVERMVRRATNCPDDPLTGAGSVRVGLRLGRGLAGPLLDLLSPEERERQRREREESRRVLLELKSVLGMRASEVERQKWKQLLFSDQAAVKMVVPTELSEPHGTSDPTDPPGPESGENHLTVDHPEEKGDPEGPVPSPPETEFCCGQLEGGEEPPHAQPPEGTTGTLHYQYDGTPEGGGEAQKNGTDWPFVPKPPALSVMDRLTELHGSDALSFSSALAAQVAARSHSFTNMEEQTFGDEDEEEEQGVEEEVTSQPRTPRQEEEDKG
ncbi:hypothetical protein AGOR_G00180920 [Albula goreensis]|uniref:Vezatin n=1 Tax=Albula goreensis TaxID=1534307 RepID=A0A8T3CWM7_9TELE|nr:hypothetical protein AGOR_G00180920 [Albula goreensis]